jgi:hypothetical protein
MKKYRVILSTVLVVLFLVLLTPQFAQDTFTNPPRPDLERRGHALGLLYLCMYSKGFDRFVLGTLPAWSAAPNAVISVNSAIERGICGYR